MRTLSPARQTLASAIVEHRDFSALYAATEAAIEYGGISWNAVRTAEAALESAKQGVEAAKKAAALHIQAAAMGNAGAPPMTIRAARDALEDAEDALRAAIEARDALRVELEQLKARVPLRKDLLRDAALAVVADEARAVALACAADLHRLQREMSAKKMALSWLIGAGALPRGTEPGWQFNQVLDREIYNDLSLMNGAPTQWSDVMREVHSVASGPWEDALAALMKDAAAPLPTEPSRSVLGFGRPKHAA